MSKKLKDGTKKKSSFQIEEGKYNRHRDGSSDEMKEILSDPRFSHVASDPRYRNVSKKEIKVHIDNRFKSALTKENFSTKPILDPRGRPNSYGSKGKLDKFYDLPSSEGEQTDDDSEESSKKEENEVEVPDTVDHSQSRPLSQTKGSRPAKEEAEVSEKFLQCLLDPERDLARGEAFYSDDSSDDDSTTTDEEGEDLGEFEWGELDRDAQWDCDGNEVEETSRFAVCNMDWDRIKAVDLMTLFSSYVSSGGVLKKVIIYPSEYGKRLMKEEEAMGPQELVRLAAGSKKGFIDDYQDLDKIQKGILNESSGASAHEIEALRRYQRNRLRYFYGVIEFDSVETAKVVYKECDRTHYQAAGVILDLRYIPSDMKFEEVPHDECYKVPESYETSDFQTTALLNAKPTLTWDEDDQRRKKTLSTVMTKVLEGQNFDEDVLKEYVACSDDEDSYEDEGDEEEEGGEEKEESIAKFRALISEIDEKERKRKESVIDMEATFDVKESDSESETEDDDSEKESEEVKNENKLSPFEKFLMKRKEKRKEKVKMKKKLSENDDKDSEYKEETDESDSYEGIEVDRNALQSGISSWNSEQPQQPQKISKLKKRGKRTKLQPHPSSAASDSLSLLIMDEEKEDKKHFDMRKIIEEKKQSEAKLTKKRKKQQAAEPNVIDNFKVDSSDPRFAALFSHRNYNLDPSHPKYDPHSALNTFVSKTSKKQKIIEEQHPPKSQSTSQLEPAVVDLIQKIKSKFSKLK